MPQHTSAAKHQHRIAKIVFDAQQRKEQDQFEAGQEGKRVVRSLQEEVQLMQAEGLDQKAKDAVTGSGSGNAQSAAQAPPLAKVNAGAVPGNLESLFGSFEDTGGGTDNVT